MSWMNCSLQTESSKEACRSWFSLVLSDDETGPVRAAIHETAAGRETEIRAVFVKNGKETEYRRRRQTHGRFTIDICDPAPWPAR